MKTVPALPNSVKGQLKTLRNSSVHLATVLLILGSFNNPVAFAQENAPSTHTDTDNKTFTEWCQQQDSVTQDQQRLIQVLKRSSFQQDCAEADEALSKLTAFSLSNLGISDLSILTSLPQITTLHLSNNKISDISPLAQLPNLSNLTLSQNQITDVRPLTAISSLKRVDLTQNPIQDLTILQQLSDDVLIYTDDRSNLPDVQNRAQISTVPEPDENLGLLPALSGRSETLASGEIAKVYQFQATMGYIEAAFEKFSSDELQLLLYLKRPKGSVELSPDQGYLSSVTSQQKLKQIIKLWGQGEGSYYLVVKKVMAIEEPVNFSFYISHSPGWHQPDQEPNNQSETAEKRHYLRSVPLVGNWHARGNLNEKDSVDFWQFTLDKPSDISIAMTVKTGYAKLDIVDASQGFFSQLRVKLEGDTVTWVGDRLPPGNYYARVATDFPGDTDYSLKLIGLPNSN